jgi:hypothetical protein
MDDGTGGGANHNKYNKTDEFYKTVFRVPTSHGSAANYSGLT